MALEGVSWSSNRSSAAPSARGPLRVARAQSVTVTALVAALSPACDAPLEGQLTQSAVEGYRRPYGPRAPWNVRTTHIPRHGESAKYRDLLWDAGDPSSPSWNVNVNYEAYTYPVYDASEATGEYTVNTTWATNIDGKKMPWNPAWRQNVGTDAQVIVLDPATGREWNLWQVSFDSGSSTVQATNGNLVQKGLDAGNGSDPASYWTKENGFRPSRGVGIPYFAMLVTPEDVAHGAIDHALSMPIINTSGCEVYAPGTKIEHPSRPCDVPEGMRFALEVTDSEIDSWIAKLPAELSAGMKSFARMLVKALRDYGWFITDTSGGAHLQLEAWESAAADWTRLGLAKLTAKDGKQYPRDLLDGILTRNRIYALVPSDKYPPSAYDTTPQRDAGPAVGPDAGGATRHDSRVQSDTRPRRDGGLDAGSRDSGHAEQDMADAGLGREDAGTSAGDSTAGEADSAQAEASRPNEASSPDQGNAGSADAAGGVARDAGPSAERATGSVSCEVVSNGDGTKRVVCEGEGLAGGCSVAPRADAPGGLLLLGLIALFAARNSARRRRAAEGSPGRSQPEPQGQGWTVA